jgi:hypothetical protein
MNVRYSTRIRIENMRKLVSKCCLFIAESQPFLSLFAMSTHLDDTKVLGSNCAKGKRSRVSKVSRKVSTYNYLLLQHHKATYLLSRSFLPFRLLAHIYLFLFSSSIMLQSLPSKTHLRS